MQLYLLDFVPCYVTFVPKHNMYIILFQALIAALLPEYSIGGREIQYELAQANGHYQTIKHKAYTLCYAEKYNQSVWVAYSLTKQQLNGKHKRPNKFMKDPQVTSRSATNEDYANSGYDRGHLAPAADMSWSAKAMEESFYYSNTSPQIPSFNRGIWKQLEEQIRIWTEENNHLYIATGPILKGNLPSIGPNRVPVPKFYYKVVLDYTAPNFKAIGFIIQNEGTKAPLSKFAVSVDSVEKVVGIDFFYQVPKAIQQKIESRADTTEWSWSYQPKGKTAQTATGVQCKAITQKGFRCSRKAVSSSGYCHQHSTHKYENR